MNTQFHSFCQRFRKSENGNATIEFVIYFSVIMSLVAAAVEIGYMNMRHTLLERGVDIAVREMRLNTENAPSFEDLRASICDNSAILENCESNLHLQLVPVMPRDLTAIPESADCVSEVADVSPARLYTPGAENQLMVVRACLKYRTMFPTTQLATALPMDEDGFSQMVVTSAFVQEPR